LPDGHRLPAQPQETTRRHFVAALEKAHSQQLRRFLSMRLRNAVADVPDLVQEIYLRLLRLKDYEAVRNPQAYLYTIASHVLHQYTLRRAAAPETMDPLEVVNALQTTAHPDPAEEADIEQRIEQLGHALEAHSPRAYAVLLMYRCEGLTFREIGERLGVSPVMARKYLVRALKFCDQHLDREQGRS
jgi:RNA polymerase sigma factor (sigma-70 family)